MLVAEAAHFLHSGGQKLHRQRRWDCSSLVLFEGHFAGLFGRQFHSDWQVPVKEQAML